MHTEPEVHEGEVLDSMPSGRLVAASQSEGAQLMSLAQQAMAMGKVSEMREILALKKEYEADEARKAFVAAMADFKAEAGGITIAKNKHVSFTTQKGKTEYDHAELHDITRALVPVMAKYGLTHAWTFKQDKGITVGCVITHRQGHKADPVEMTAAADESGGKNSIQAIASTKTYLERYTLLAATGMATGGEIDYDGRTFDVDVVEVAHINDEQEIALRDVLEAYVTDQPAFFGYLASRFGYPIEKLTDIRATDFDRAKAALAEVRKRAEASHA